VKKGLKIIRKRILIFYRVLLRARSFNRVSFFNHSTILACIVGPLVHRMFIQRFAIFADICLFEARDVAKSFSIFAMQMQIFYNDHIIVLYIKRSVACAYPHSEHYFIPNHLLRAVKIALAAAANL